MSEAAAAPPTLGDQIADALKDSPHPLKLADLVKKLPRPSRKVKADDHKERVKSALEEELRAGRAFSCPSGKKEEVRYWGKDERHRVRERAVVLAEEPLALPALAKAVAKEVGGTEASFVEGVLRDMIGAEVLFAHAGKGKGGTLVAAHPPAPPPPPLEQGKHPAAVKKLFDICAKLAMTAGVGLEDVLAALRKQAGGAAAPAEPTAEKPPEPAGPPSVLPPVPEAELVRRIHEAVEREGTMSLQDLRRQMPAGGRGDAFDRVVLALEEAGKVSLGRDKEPGYYSPEEQAEFVREGEFFFTSIAKRS